MRVGGAQWAPPPSQTGRADLPHPAFRSAAVDGLAQANAPRRSEGARQPRRPCGPAHPVTGGPLPAGEPLPSGSPPHRRAQPYGTTSALARWPRFGSQHCLPTPLGSTVVTRFLATTGALTPTGPFVIACRGSLIHVTRTSHHSVSNHPRFSTRRVPLPQRWPHYFVRASPCTRKLARTADRIEFTLSAHPDGTCYGLGVHFQLLSTRGYGPDAVTFSYWPYSVGQVRDFHPAVPVRSQAHERGLYSPQQRANRQRSWIGPKQTTTQRMLRPGKAALRWQCHAPPTALARKMRVAVFLPHDFASLILSRYRLSAASRLLSAINYQLSSSPTILPPSFPSFSSVRSASRQPHRPIERGGSVARWPG